MAAHLRTLEFALAIQRIDEKVPEITNAKLVIQASQIDDSM